MQPGYRSERVTHRRIDAESIFTLECENEQLAPPHVEVRYLRLTPQNAPVAS